MSEDTAVGSEISADFPALDENDEDELLPQLVAHLHENRTQAAPGVGQSHSGCASLARHDASRDGD